MISDPNFFLEQFAQAGGDSFLVHWEGNNNLYRTIRRIKELEKPVGVVINPATPALVLEEILGEANLVLVMTINPGFGGQRFLQMTVPKIRQVRQMIEQINPNCELELDGGIDPTTAPIGVAAGADVLVAGSTIFEHADGVAAGMKQLQLSVNRAGTS
jgi:ribulose-phosphate 3-epimerase